MLPAPDARAEVLFESPHFIVTGVFPGHMLAMKVRAARSRGPEDVKSLARELGIARMDGVLDVHRGDFPHDTIPWRSECRVGACLQEVFEGRCGPVRPGRTSTRNADGE